MIVDRRKKRTSIFFRNGKIQLINIIVFSGIFSLLILLGYVYNSISIIPSQIKQTNEVIWREQARRTLKDLKTQLLSDIQDGLVDPNNDASLQKWGVRRLMNVRNGGETSDAFMIELSNRKFILDGSPDCSKEDFLKNGRYVIDEPVNQFLAKEYFRKHNIVEMLDKNIIRAKDLLNLEKTNPEIIKYFRENKYIIHSNYVLAEKVYDEMEQSFDTDSSSLKWWQFDDSKEFLEWIIIPAPRTGFDGKSNTTGGLKNSSYRTILIQLGTQEDEINKKYLIFNTYIENIKMIIVSIGFVLILLGLLFMINILFLQEECFKCPNRKQIIE